jgi:sterol desaturase/sphingolipid hydroxylase (fatty acid hydroxylase superfamily)
MIEKIEQLIGYVQRYLSALSYPATRWYFGASCVVLALISYGYYHARSRGWSVAAFLRYLFPKSIYFHRSTKQDALYVLSFPLIAGLLFKPALAFGTAAWTYKTAYSALSMLGSVSYEIPDATWFVVLLTIAFTVLSAMAADFMFYLHHYVLHKVKFMWEFHKVHHSAEALTPLTDYRAHPLEILSYGTAKGIGVGAAQGVFNYLAGGQVHVYSILGLNALIFLYYTMGYSLRHSHVWISYGPFFSRLFISPAQHQIHHSKAEKHWDKNLGGAFALWDWMFGTLYIPRQREDLEFGLADGDQEDYTGVANLYVQPFRKNSSSPLRLLLVIALIAVFLYFSGKNLLGLLSRAGSE